MFDLSANFALTDGTTIAGAAILEDFNNSTLRYVGNTIDSANAGLSDLVTAQDMVTKLFDSDSSFVDFINALITNGLGVTARAVSADSTVRSVKWRFSATFTSGEYIYVAGSSSDESPTIRSSSLATVIPLLAADADFMNLISGVAS
jgi:hypothetical protein